jgi:hypothetical protein
VRLTPDPATRRPDPEPQQTDLARIVLVGVVIWAVLLVVALFSRDWLDDRGSGWMVWVPLWGVALGLIGLPWARRNSG